jgi:hypothetical protein
MKYLVKFEGSFGFIKPWMAVRDSKTQSSNCLTPSIEMGIERKLFPELTINENGKLNKILRYRLSFQSISFQQESTRSINYERKTAKIGNEKYFIANVSTVKRGLLINPVLYLMFDSKEDADNSMSQHICLCRNEDVMLPIELIALENESEFDDKERFAGYESFSCEENADNSIYCGLNKYTKNKQYIQFKMIGTPNDKIT